MERKKIVAGGVCAVAVLLPLGQWVLGARQDAADKQASQEVERRFREQRTASVAGQPQVDGGQWGQERHEDQRRGQDHQGGRHRWSGEQREQAHNRRMQEMAQQVGLNPTQVKNIQAIQQSARPMMRDVFRNPQLSREQKMAQMQQMRAAQQTQIAKVLTPEQQTKYATYQQQMRERWQARRRESGGPGGWGGAASDRNEGTKAGGQN